jgi:GAF domain-containing protein
MNLSNSDSPVNVPINDSGVQDVEKFRTILLQNYLNGSLILGTILLFINLYYSVQSKNIAISAILFILFGILFLATFLRSLPPTLRIVLLVFDFYATGCFSLISSGLNSNAILYFFIAVIFLGILMKGSWWIAGLLVFGLTISLIGVLINLNFIRHGIYLENNNSLLYWITSLTILLFLMFVLVAPLSQYIINLRNKYLEFINNDRAITSENKSLLDRVTSLETEADRRRSRLIAARQISREISQQTSIDKLMSDAVDLIRSQFGFYHVGIFLADDKNEYAVLKAATGSVGSALISRNHRLRIREEGIVGYVVARGEPRIAVDVGEDSAHFKNPDLPDTRSEMAVPLRVGPKIIGALDAQSDKENAFTTEDVDILQSIADQLAIAIDKASEISSLTRQVAELEQGYGLFTRGVWRSHLRGSKNTLNYSYMNDRLSSESQTHEFDSEVLSGGNSILSENKLDNNESPESIFAVPIKIREQVLGVINIRFSGKSVPVNLISLIETATNRLAIALENARLLEEIQERAEREHIVGEISSKVRSAQSIETILQTAVSELGKTLGVNEVSIQLKTTDVEK